ncbi:MAG: NAD(P)-binding protein [Proteobacteria bacterium]|nr:NAD(P)-binding protein [Pseudomonadota bacterium]MDB4826556.1 NAD(P)-binding protein [Gammaproteobacteria bacterium]MBT4108108.1 NAD(P)-binding protein [Pseudomonadota bacterium]MBT4987189.1 NAD(P)-binding protein [Pseudomonadota bacterium]MBT5189096.1 NAD(P)-binding protein [Pseudomonadota bacterium]
MAASEEQAQKLTFRKYEEGDSQWQDFKKQIFNEDNSHKCPTYVHRTPPCQGSCPSGEDIRGWLQIVRGMEHPPEGMTWQEYAFRRATDANPFPAMMGRVCPAPCESGCNRNNVDDFVGINSVEQFIGDTAFTEGFQFEAAPNVCDKRVAIVGGGPAGLAGAYQLRRLGYASTILESQEKLGGMFRYGIPGYRTPRERLDREIDRILELGDIEVRFGVRVGTDVSIAELESEFDAILWAVGCQSGRDLPIEGWEETPNCVSGVSFLDAFNKGSMKVTAERVVCIGGGDTSIDVVSVARRLGKIEKISDKDRPEEVIGGYAAHDSAMVAARQGAQVTLTALFERPEMTATEEEVDDALTEGVTIINGVLPIGLVRNESGRATALRLAKCQFSDKGVPTPVEGTEFEVEADLIVSAIGQAGDLSGIEEMGNERQLIDADHFFQVPDREGHFVAGDIVRPHLLTTAIGQAAIAAKSVDHYLKDEEPGRRPKVDVHHFDLLAKLNEQSLAPVEYDHSETWGTAEADFAVHNYEDRSAHEIIPSDGLFLGHFEETPRNMRATTVPSSEEVLGHFEERHHGLNDDAAKSEAERCMSCGLCFECDNCIIFCPQDAVFKVSKDQYTTGRYVDTDYSKCIGCHICADVCPSGYIDMGMGE